ncbi:hypothetical protein FSP39_024036 [Pinctada imbricata]|uniref:Phospholipid scramblase n=1 Tax=Pinctada imbricata TaxID=66713 RepID=A0AA88YL93_PINIB|nr:hypothetical protein FSP39_024036 [Pinctada imbricata]
MRVLRPVRCPCGVCWWWCCCVQEMTIESPIQNPIGNITERRLLCCPHYNITDNNDDVVFVIKFACCLCKLCCDVSIPIYHAKSGDVVSEITKASGSNWAECCGTKNDYNIKFLQPLGIHEKMLILGASFLIDFNFFENQQRSCC